MKRKTPKPPPGTGLRPRVKPVAVQKWIVSRTPANPAIAQGYHIQVSTGDTLAGFVVIPGMIPLPPTTLNISRGKSTGGDDYFTLNLANAVTFNLVGKIEYLGDWTGIP